MKVSSEKWMVVGLVALVVLCSGVFWCWFGSAGGFV